MQIQNLSDLSKTKRQFDSNKELASQLKIKKKQLIIDAQSIKNTIQQTCASITTAIMDRQTDLCQQLKSQLLKTLERIEQSLSMSQNQRDFHKQQILEILGKQFSIPFLDQTKLLKTLNKFLCLQLKNNPQSDQFTSNRKILTHQENHQLIIEHLQTKIEKMLLAQEKLRKRVQKLQFKKSTQKKKVNWEEEEPVISRFKVQRLQAEINILTELNRTHSEKIGQLVNENAKMKQILKRDKLMTNSIFDKTFEISQPQRNDPEKKDLQNQVQRIRSECQLLQNQKHDLKMSIVELNEYINQITLKLQQTNIQKQALNTQINQLVAEKQKYLECFQTKNTQYNSLLNDYSNLQQAFKQLEQTIANLKTMKKIQEDMIKNKQKQIEKHEKEIAMMKQSYAQRIRQVQKQLEKYIQISHDLELQLQNMQHKQLATQRSLTQKFSILFEQKKILEKKLHQQQSQVYNLQNEMKQSQLSAMKITREKETTIKKQFNKKKKDIDKQYEQEKKQLVETFNIKYATMLQRIDAIKIQVAKMENLHQGKYRIYDDRIKVLKEISLSEFQDYIEKCKAKINSQTLQKYIESTLSLHVKNTQIKQLKQELSQLKKGYKPIEQIKHEAPLSQKYLDQHIFQLQKKILQENSKIMQQSQSLEIQTLREKLSLMQEKYRTHQQQIQKLLEEKTKITQQLNKKCSQQSKCEQTMSKEFQKEKKKIEEKITRLEQQNKNNRILIKKLQTQNSSFQAENKTKKDLILGYKKQIKEKQQKQLKLTNQCKSVNEQLQKLKKDIKDNSNKDTLYREIKQKYEQLKKNYKQLEEYSKAYDQKSRAMKYQINQKQQQIRNIKEELEQFRKERKSQNKQQLSNLEDKSKKLLWEIDRKEELFKHKQKNYEKSIKILQEKVQKLQEELRKTKLQKQNNKTKNQTLKIQITKEESKNKLLEKIIKQLYQRTYETYQNQTQEIDYNNTFQSCQEYSQGLQILQLTSKDLGLSTLHTNSRRGIMKQSKIADIRKIENLLRQEDIDVRNILNEFTSIMSSK